MMADSPVLHFHNSLRQAKERWAIFLGAGASYDYGIPTMVEIASILRKMIKEGKPEHGISKSTLSLLTELCPDEKGGSNWNIEDLLTRLHQLLDAAASPHAGFAPVTTAVGKTQVDSKAISRASEELIQFMAEMCGLASQEYTDHGSGQVDYLSAFFLAMASFGTPMNRLVRVFTTNIDLCVEAAMVRLSQRSRHDRRPDLVLVDGFESAILPTFNMGCYTRAPSAPSNRCAVYYWKLHGSVDWTYAQPLAKEGAKEEEGFSDQSIIVRRIENELWGHLAKCGALHAKPTGESRRIVIFPTPAKYSQTYTFPYMDMFEAFRRTLEEVELLICVGTSFPDQHIRSAVRSFVERDNTLLFVVDPQVTSEALKSYFGQSRSVQPVISMGFEKFVQEFKTLEEVSGRASSLEDKS
jgi:NAD-dependent SIR2 family protein deacetylase